MKRKDEGGREPEALDLPDTVDLAAVNEAEIAVIRAAGRRGIAAREAYWLSRMLEHRRRAIGDRTLEEQMKALEKALRLKAEKP